jgi:hypothetical protein
VPEKSSTIRSGSGTVRASTVAASGVIILITMKEPCWVTSRPIIVRARSDLEATDAAFGLALCASQVIVVEVTAVASAANRIEKSNVRFICAFISPRNFHLRLVLKWLAPLP